MAEVIDNGHMSGCTWNVEAESQQARLLACPGHTIQTLCIYSSLPTSPARLTEALPLAPGTKPSLTGFLLQMILSLLIYKAGKWKGLSEFVPFPGVKHVLDNSDVSITSSNWTWKKIILLLLNVLHTMEQCRYMLACFLFLSLFQLSLSAFLPSVL